ncbi:UNVERIFIED_CONTAM: hypothetical protein Sindi_2004500 [Sesamum indicum]
MLHRLCGPPSIPLSFILARTYSPGGILNALATALHGSIRTAPSIHRLRLGLLGYLIPFAPLAFVSQCQCRPAECFRRWCSFRSLRISPLHRKFPLPLPYSSLVVSTACPGLSPGFDGGLKKPPTDALRPIIPDNACILCLTAAAGTELADAYSPDTVIASSPGKEVHDPWAFYLHAALLRSGFRPLRKIPHCCLP